MDNLDIINHNIRIAIFMGWKLDDTFPDKGKVYRSPRNNVELASTLKFHSDWDWIMPVIEKIESMGYLVELGGYDFTIRTCSEESYSYPFLFHYASRGSRKEAAYWAIIAFLSHLENPREIEEVSAEHLQIDRLIEWCDNEIIERRDYSASKVFELVKEKLEQIK